MVFLERLEALLKERRLTWKEVSTQCHIGRNQKKYWQDNEIIPGTETLLKLADFFGVSTDYLRGTDTLKEEALNILDNQTITLSAREAQLIFKYRKLDDEGRTMVESTLIQELRRIATDKGEADTASVG